MSGAAARGAAVGLAVLALAAPGAAGQEPPAAAPEIADAAAALPRPDLTAVSDTVRHQLETARRGFEHALAGGPGAPQPAEAVGGLCRLYLAYDFLEAAEPCLELARRLFPADPEWPYLSGYLHDRRGRPEAAVAALEQAARLDPGDAAARLRLGNLHLTQRRTAQARRWYEAAVAADASCVAARHGLGEVASSEGDDEAAVAAHRRVLEQVPDSTHARYALGMALRRLGRREEAVEQLRRADLRQTAMRPWWGCADPRLAEVSRLATGASAHLLRGLEAGMLGDAAAELAEYRKAVELDPADAVARKSLGTALYAAGDLAGAEEQLREAARLDPDDPAYPFDLGQILLRRGLPEEAREQFARAAELDPAFDRAHRRLAELALSAGEADAAVRHLRRLVELDPMDARARAELARLAWQAGRREEAIELLGRLLDDRPPDDPKERLRLSAMLAQMGDAARAEHHFRAVIALDAPPEIRSQAHALLGQLRLGQGRPEDAVEELEAAVALDPDSPAVGLLEEARRRLEP